MASAVMFSREKPVDYSLQSTGAPQDGLYTCRQGRYNYDPDIRVFAVPPVHGSLAKYVEHPADFCVKLPDALTYEQGAMVEPSAVQVSFLTQKRKEKEMTMPFGGVNEKPSPIPGCPGSHTHTMLGML
jgi:hypothetical protein